MFCRVESKGVRMTPVLEKGIESQKLYEQVAERFGFVDPYVEGVDEV